MVVGPQPRNLQEVDRLLQDRFISYPLHICLLLGETQALRASSRSNLLIDAAETKRLLHIARSTPSINAIQSNDFRCALRISLLGNMLGRTQCEAKDAKRLLTSLPSRKSSQGRRCADMAWDHPDGRHVRMASVRAPRRGGWLGCRIGLFQLMTALTITKSFFDSLTAPLARLQASES